MTFRKAFCLSVSALILSSSMVLASPRPFQGQTIAMAREGDAALAYVGHFLSSGEAFGYVTYIAGFDRPLFSSDTRQDETTAYFTFRNVALAPPRIFQRGSLVIMQMPAHVRGFYDDTPDGDFARPESFTDGTLVYEADAVLRVSIDQRLGNGDATTTVSYKQVFAGSFTVGGASFTFGEIGLRAEMSAVATIDPSNPTVLFVAGQLKNDEN